MKHRVEEALAQAADGGVIVEIGVGRGNGLKAIWGGTAQGRRLHVYGVDPFLPYRDPLGGEYGPDCKAETLQAIEHFASYVTLIERKAEDVAPTWAQPVALLWLDLSMPYAELRAILDAWVPHVMPGGVVGITGLEYGNLGTRQLYAELAGNGWQAIMTDQDKVAVLRKAPPRRAVVYLCNDGDGGRYVREAACSAESAKRNLDGLPCFLFLQGERVGSFEKFDAVYPLPAPRGPFWYLDSTRHFNQVVRQLAEYQQLLYLDVDTHVCCPCLDIFLPLAQFDMLFGLSASRDAIDSAIGCPASFPTPQIGVNVFNNSARVQDFLAYWLDLYERHWRIYDNNDEAPMRDALYSYPGLRVGPLSPEYGLRFDFGAWVNGRVRILHGREGGISTNRAPLSRICEEINSSTAMRHWHHGLGRTE